MEAPIRVLKGAEEQLHLLAKDGPSLGLLVGLTNDGIPGRTTTALIVGALQSSVSGQEQLQDQLYKEAGRLLDVLPGGFQPVGAFWSGPSQDGSEARSLADAALSLRRINGVALAILAKVDGEDERPKYFDTRTTSGDAPGAVRKPIEVHLVDDNPLWQTHVPLRCKLPISLQISSASTSFPTPQELSTASEKAVHDLRSVTAAFLVDSSGSPFCSVLVQPWDEEASISGRGFAAGGANGSAKKGGGKGKKKPAAQEVQEERNFEELTCGDLGAAEVSSLQSVPSPVRVTFLQRQSPSGEALQAPYLSFEPVALATTLHSVPLSLDVLCSAPAGMRIDDALRELLVPALEKQLRSAAQLALEHERGVVAHLFQHPRLQFPVTALFPHFRDEGEQTLVDIRTRLHLQLGLPLDRPLLRAANALTFGDGHSGSAEASTSGRLLDVHHGIRPSGVAQGKLSLIHGSYEYYHYMQDRIDDKGWGCAYRSLQTIVSWFRLQKYTAVPVPSHRTIQQTLVDLQDKEPSFVGSSQWIGAIELGYILDTLLGVTCKILNVSSGADMPSKARELAHHFETQGTPVMIGGGVLAYTLLGIDYNELTGDCAFLILDPHYTGGENLKSIQNGQWIGWKRGGANGIFLQNAFYNLLLPQRPHIV